MLALVRTALGKKETEIALKRLAFGPQTKGVHLQVSLENIDELDFTIERRSGRSFEDNRYFSSAPLRTSDHLVCLEQIEKLLQAAN